MKIYIGRYQDYNKKTQTTPERKIRVRIDKWDTWSMDHTLSYIILPMLKQLQATQHGAGHTDDVDVPEELRSAAAEPKENEYDTDSNHFKRWDWIMDEMIWAFEMNLDENAEDQFYSGKHHTFKVDREGLDKFEARKRNGFRLFGRYFQNLWD